MALSDSQLDHLLTTLHRLGSAERRALQQKLGDGRAVRYGDQGPEGARAPA
jgi:hypothetical protein